MVKEFTSSKLSVAKENRDKARTKLIKALKKNEFGMDIQLLVDTYNSASKEVEYAESELIINKRA